VSTHQPDRPADRFATAYAALVDDLSVVLDLTSGAAEATHFVTYDTLAADLSTQLRLDTGLAAIIGGTPASAPPAESSPSITSSTPPIDSLADQLRSLTDTERLRFRPRYRTLRRELALDRALDIALDRAHNLAVALDRTRDHVRGHALGLDPPLELDHSINRLSVRDLDHALRIARDRAHDLAREFDLDQAHARARKVINLVRDRTLDNDLVLDSAIHLTRDLISDLDHPRVLNRARVHDLARELRLDLPPTGISGLLEGLTEIADNFMGADLRSVVDFDAAGWEGVRWSPTTAWPPGWAERVRRISDEIKPGIFQVVRDGQDSRRRQEAGT
jgi:hypothetical protein